MWHPAPLQNAGRACTSTTPYRTLTSRSSAMTVVEHELTLRRQLCTATNMLQQPAPPANIYNQSVMQSDQQIRNVQRTFIAHNWCTDVALPPVTVAHNLVYIAGIGHWLLMRVLYCIAQLLIATACTALPILTTSIWRSITMSAIAVHVHGNFPYMESHAKVCSAHGCCSSAAPLSH